MNSSPAKLLSVMLLVYAGIIAEFLISKMVQGVPFGKINTAVIAILFFWFLVRMNRQKNPVATNHEVIARSSKNMVIGGMLFGYVFVAVMIPLFGFLSLYVSDSPPDGIEFVIVGSIVIILESILGLVVRTVIRNTKRIGIGS